MRVYAGFGEEGEATRHAAESPYGRGAGRGCEGGVVRYGDGEEMGAMELRATYAEGR